MNILLAHALIHNLLGLAADVSWILPSITRTPSAPHSALVFKRFVLLKTIPWCTFIVKCWLVTATPPARAAFRDAPAIVDGEARSLVLRALRFTRCRLDQSNSTKKRAEKLTKKVSSTTRPIDPSDSNDKDDNCVAE